MARRIGPSGHYPLGEPLGRSDRGHIDVGFSPVPPRHGKMWFGSFLDWFCLTPPTARTMTKTIREALTAEYGHIQPARSQPFVVTCDMQHGAVMVQWSKVTATVVAPAEVWLALMDRIDEECRKLTL